MLPSRYADRPRGAQRGQADGLSGHLVHPIQELNRRVFLEVRRAHQARRHFERHEPEPRRRRPERLQDLVPAKDPRSFEAEGDVAVPRAVRAHARAMGEKWKKVRVKRGGGQRTSSTSAVVFTGPVYTSLPRRDFDLTPVMTRRTRTVWSSSSSTVQPQMIRACGLIFWPTISAARSASETVRSPPPTTRTRAPRAWVRSTSPSKGDSRASLIAYSIRSRSSSLSPIPIIATPPPFMMVMRSA